MRLLGLQGQDPAPGLGQTWGCAGREGQQGRGFREGPVTHRSRPGATGAAVTESSCGSGGWVPASGANHRQPGSVPTSAGRAAVYPDLLPNCWGPAAPRHFTAGQGRGGPLTPWGLGNCIGPVCLGQRSGLARHSSAQLGMAQCAAWHSPRGRDVPLSNAQIHQVLLPSAWPLQLWQ